MTILKKMAMITRTKISRMPTNGHDFDFADRGGAGVSDGSPGNVVVVGGGEGRGRGRKGLKGKTDPEPCNYTGYRWLHSCLSVCLWSVLQNS
jgi:hypothetical protein